MQNYFKCRYCDKDFEKTTMKGEFKRTIPYYCSDECYQETYYILSALYEFHNHDDKKTWAEFEEAVWGFK